jgi:hypothetical protein
MPKGMTDTPPSKNWRHEAPLEPEIKMQKKAIALYIIKNKLEDKFPKPAIATYRAIIPILAELEDKWIKVKPEKFRPHKFLAFRRAVDTWRNMLDSAIELKSIIGEIKTDFDAAKDGGNSSDSDDYDSESDQENQDDQHLTTPVKTRRRDAMEQQAAAAHPKGPDIFLRPQKDLDQDQQDNGDGSQPLAITDAQKILKLGELHAEMCQKVMAAKEAVEAWNIHRSEMPYLDQPRIPSMLVWGAR